MIGSKEQALEAVTKAVPIMGDDQTTYRVETEQEQLEDDLEPPYIIVVQGSSESGKTTLIKSLVHHFAK